MSWQMKIQISFRDRPFNLQEGVMVFRFVKKKNFGQYELEYISFLSREARIFFLEFNIRLYD